MSVSPVRLGLVSIAMAASCFVLGAIAHAVLAAVMPGEYVFGMLYRMFLYHRAFPYQYVAVVAVTWGVVFAVSAPFVSRLAGWKRRLAIVVGMLGAVVLASIPGGVLWKLHDMQAGTFPEGDRLWADLVWGATTGLATGWLVVALSVPYNVIGLALGYTVTEAGLRALRPGRALG